MEAEKKQKPAAVYTAYPVEATIWENERVVNGARTTVYAVRIARPYKTAEGAWKSTASFAVEDLPKVLYVVASAYAALLNHLVITPEADASQEVGACGS